MSKSVSLLLLSANEIPLVQKFTGVITIENAVSESLDNINIENYFGLGDIVLCKVKSLNESQKILLRCDEKGLGVLFARGKENERMLPINRLQVKGVQSGIVERRKAALI
jgi:exosome complex RNA-binding protein Csl4